VVLVGRARFEEPWGATRRVDDVDVPVGVGSLGVKGDLVTVGGPVRAALLYARPAGELQHVRAIGVGYEEGAPPWWPGSASWRPF